MFENIGGSFHSNSTQISEFWNHMV